MDALPSNPSLVFEALRLKALPRKGWLRVGIATPESVAAHSWGIALLGTMLTPPELDRGKVLLIAAVHDLAEALVGDITPHDGVNPADKHRLEEDAMARFSSLPNGDELHSAWLEYEHGSTPEGRFVKALDKLDMGLQALAYRREGFGTEEFLASARKGLIAYPALLAFLDGLDATRDAPGPP
jgi:putative hydrolase of HD superfamily